MVMLALKGYRRQGMDQALINQHLDALARLDGDVRRGLAQVGYPPPRLRDPGFATFVSTLVSQQISTDAAAAIMARLRELLPRMEAEPVLRLPAGALRTAGLSARKVEYLEGLARAVVERKVDLDGLADLDDPSAVEAITTLRGFGVWSAEIYLMFSLQRTDIFPAGDLAIRVALQKLKRIDTPPDEAQSRELVEHWSPYRSAGSLFLWHFYRGAPT